jgi:CDP-diacylglycerol--glycerol-3-phosphate 3-phosphatidyltransferase
MDFRVPRIAVPAGSVEALGQPERWHARLVARVASARSRVALSALYWGGGARAAALAAALDGALAARPQLRVDVLLDGLRARRAGGAGGAESALALLAPLLRRHGAERVRLRLFEAPHLRGLARRCVPSRYNEAFGVQHMKAAVVDDAVLITGANLSQDYFDNRQDRYWELEAPPLADLYAELVAAVARHAAAVAADGSVAPAPVDLARAPKAAVDAHAQSLAAALTGVLNAAADAALGRDEKGLRPSPPCCVWDAAPAAAPLRPLPPALPLDAVLVTPSVQFAAGGILLDSTLTRAALAAALRARACALANRRHHSVALASAYLNLTEDYLGELAAMPPAAGAADWDDPVELVTAAPSANGFYQAPGLAKYIVHGYVLLEKRVARRLHGRPVVLREYERNGWTYHAKGLWSIPGEAPGGDAEEAMTLIGSSNFGLRSRTRDLESQLLLQSRAPEFVAALRSEREGLAEYERVISDDELHARRVAPWVPLVMPILLPLF